MAEWFDVKVVPTATVTRNICRQCQRDVPMGCFYISAFLRRAYISTADTQKSKPNSGTELPKRKKQFEKSNTRHMKMTNIYQNR